MRVTGEVTVMKVKPGEQGGFLDVIDFQSGSIFSFGVDAVNGLKPEQKVRLDGELSSGKGKYGMFLRYKGPLAAVQAGK